MDLTCNYCGTADSELEQTGNMNLPVYFGFDVKDISDMFETKLCPDCLIEIYCILNIFKLDDCDENIGKTAQQIFDDIVYAGTHSPHTLTIALVPFGAENYNIFEITPTQITQLSKYLTVGCKPIGNNIENLFRC